MALILEMLFPLEHPD